MTVMDIVTGLLIGGVLGIINAWVLRTGVRFAVKCSQRAKATLVIIASYVIRYILIAVVIYEILTKGNTPVATTHKGILGLLTILLALIQRRRGPAEERGS